MELPIPHIRQNEKDTYAFHLSLFTALCRSLEINGMESTEIADVFGMPEAILSLFMRNPAPIPAPEAIISSDDLEIVRYYPPFSHMGTTAFEDYRSKIALLKTALEED